MVQTAVRLRRPTIKIKFITEKNDYELQYDTGITIPSNNFLGESIISISSKNSMSDDTGVFTFVITGDTYWDRVLNANDLVLLQIYPNGTSGVAPDRPSVMLGMISEVALEGDYGSNSKMYRITGKSLAKAFINLQLGMIQAVNVNIAEGVGWLPDTKTSDGSSFFTGSNAKNLVLRLYDRFKGYMNYNYTNNGKKTGITSYLDLDVDSWTAYESLSTVTPFINYEGSFKQLLDDVAQKPFNELYFDTFENEKVHLIMRPTPFDSDKWTELPVDYLDSSNVISEDVARSDNEVYSVFTVNVEDAQALGLNTVDFGVYPQTFLPLVAKFGYTNLEVDNRYLMATSQEYDTDDDADSSDTETGDSTDSNAEASTNLNDNGSYIDDTNNPLATIYNKVMAALQAYNIDEIRQYKSTILTRIQNVDNRITKAMATTIYETFTKNKALSLPIFMQITDINADNAAGTATKSRSYQSVKSYLTSHFPVSAHPTVEGITASLISVYKNINTEMATAFANAWLTGYTLSKTSYTAIVKKYKSSSSNANGDTLKLFTQKIANWYCENPNFFSGSYKVAGDPDYHVGNRLVVRDQQEDILWEFYIEGVQHDFTYEDGYTTTLTVTRGLKNGSDRFSNLYGKSSDFKGGYLGEHSLAELAAESSSASDSSSGSGSSSSGSGKDGTAVAMNALSYGLQYIKGSGYTTVYAYGKGRQNTNPFEGSQPFAMDCSAFVYWCYRQAGVNLNGGSTGVTTNTILADPQLSKISSYGSKTASIFDNMQKGDIVFFHSNNGHVGIYAGSKKFVGFNGDGSWDTEGGCKLVSMDTDSGYWWTEFQGRVVRYGA